MCNALSFSDKFTGIFLIQKMNKNCFHFSFFLLFQLMMHSFVSVDLLFVPRYEYMYGAISCYNLLHICVVRLHHNILVATKEKQNLHADVLESNFFFFFQIMSYLQGKYVCDKCYKMNGCSEFFASLWGFFRDRVI